MFFAFCLVKVTEVVLDSFPEGQRLQGYKMLLCLNTKDGDLYHVVKFVSVDFFPPSHPKITTIFFSSKKKKDKDACLRGDIWEVCNYMDFI